MKEFNIDKEIGKYTSNMFKKLGIIIQPIKTKKEFLKTRNFSGIFYDSNNLDDK